MSKKDGIGRARGVSREKEDGSPLVGSIDYLSELTVAPVTTRIRDIPTEVLVDRAEGLPRESAINLDHVQTVAKSNLGAVIGVLPSGRWPAVQQALCFALGFRAPH